MALAVSGSVVALSERQCSDAARGKPISLLPEDADRSATSELGGSRPRYTFEACPTHRDAYVASRATRACSRVGCPRVRTHVREGIPLCDEHLRPSVTWHDEPPAVPPVRTRSPSPGRIAPAAELPADLQAPARAWIRWSEPGPLATQAYFASGFQLMGRATNSKRQNLRTSIYIPDLDLNFSVLSDLAAGGINAGQAEQMALSRAPVVVDPPWSGQTGHNQHGDPLPYTAAQSLTRGDFSEGYAVHHLERIPPADEQPQPGTPRRVPLKPITLCAESETPLAPVEPTAPDLQALGDYMSARLSGRSAQDAPDAGATEGQAPGNARQNLARATAWYQSHHAAPQDPAAAAALVELLDPVARSQALGTRKAAVSPPAPPVQKATGLPPAPTGRSRSPSPAPRNAAAMFLGPRMSTLPNSGRVSTFDNVASATRAARPPSLSQTPVPLLARGIPGMALPRDHYAGRTPTPPAEVSQGSVPDANTRALQCTARSQRAGRLCHPGARQGWEHR